MKRTSLSKGLLRKELLNLRKHESEKKEKSQMIIQRVKTLPEVQSADIFHVYCSFGDEVCTNELIHNLHARGVTLYTSITPEQGFVLQHCILAPETTFHTGKYGVPVPHVPQNLLHTNEQLGKYFRNLPVQGTSTVSACIIVPLVGFDEECHRLGFGKGYYDRFLARLHAPHIRTIGLAFECQKALRIPTEDYDIPLDCVVTESFLLYK
jgi:5-formyltetrahydrofolate cyclo-ligase